MNIIVDEADRLTALVSSVMELSKVTSAPTSANGCTLTWDSCATR